MIIDEIIAWSRRLISGAFLAALASAVAQAGMFAIGVMVARLAGRQVFGDWSIVYGTVLTAVSFGTMGTGFTAIRFAAEFRYSDPDELARMLKPIHRLNFWMASGAMITIFAAANWICAYALRRPELGTALRSCSGFVLFSVLLAYWAGLLSGMEKYPRQLANNSIAAATSVLSSWLMLRSGETLPAPIIGATIASLITYLLHRSAGFRVLGDSHRSIVRPNKATWRMISSVMVPASLGGVASSIALWSVQVVLSRHDQKGFALADFFAAYGLRNIAFFGLQFLNSAAAVIMSASIREEAGQRQVSLELVMHAITVVAASIIVIAICLFPAHLLALFGKGFSESIPVLRVLGVSIIFEAFGGSLYNVLLVRRRLISNFWLAVLPREVVRVAVSVALIPSLGALGAAYGFFAAALVFVTVTASQIGWHAFGRGTRSAA